MPRGGARVGAGRPRKPLELIAKGSYRPSRHGPRPAAAVLRMPAADPVTWMPSDADVAGLSTDGRALIARVLAAYEPTVIDGLQLLEAARAADVLARLRAAPEPDLREQRQWAAFYTSTVRMLGLTK